MADLLELAGGSDVSCLDGPCGTLGRLIVDPAARSVTHLSVEPKGLVGNGRLVPIEQVQSIGGVIQLRCATTEFEALDSNEDSHLMAVPGSRPGSMGPAWITLHQIPDGEIEVNGDENILGTDGRAGHLRGLGVDAIDYRIKQLLLDVGHLSGKRKVAIPIEMVTNIDADGFHLTLSKAQVSTF